MKKIILTLLASLFLSLMANANAETANINKINVIPYPRSVELTGKVFNKKKIDRVTCEKVAGMPAESYELHIKKNRIVIKHSDEAGRFYALQTLKQLAEADVIYCGIIKDQPRFEWRGFMLDEARHFFGKEQVKELLDMMARYKLNRFHWHLSDDQGWRVEIKAYPGLCETGAVGCYSDSNAPAKYYTQDEIREIVAYAQERHIEVIPEIDMPGHTTAFTKTFPEFDGGHRTVNPAKEELYSVLATIMKELSELFPGRYIHVGGDEVSKRGWSNSPEINELMKTKGMSISDVQPYFERRLSEIVFATGKEIVAWDDVIDSKIDNNKTILDWWHTEHPELLGKGVEKGFRMIVCPDRPFYLDFIQDSRCKVGHLANKFINRMQDIYEFPIPDNPLVIGTQSNLWSERVRTGERIDYMIYPRIMALAEKAWTCNENMDFNEFVRRVENEYKYLDSIKVYYYDIRNHDSHPEPAK